jgi:hypothetical protein
MINNKLDRTFGSIGSFAGLLILAFGVYACFYHWIGITTVVVGAFLAFTNTSSRIDFENKRIKFSNNFFGIISVGYWTEVKPGMKFMVRNVLKTQTASSQSNRQTSIVNQDFRITLFSDSDRELLDVKRFFSKEDAEKELPDMIDKLGLNV